jgi:hypothetical protein
MKWILFKRIKRSGHTGTWLTQGGCTGVLEKLQLAILRQASLENRMTAFNHSYYLPVKFGWTCQPGLALQPQKR